ncbi:YciI family protein [Nocardioides bruguierae]|uniref:YciI family protein n=1 Tax=Nocardioides bruguierae TaxID=2945102 RepID=A0A9X2D5Z1_9ACTN|nr:YciI family protein [Nocardioides bruguierae]MCM0620022.1 YciI family protein [Nocardioides bruguierae]
MTQYLIFFNQQWVGDHPAEWFAERGPLARAAVEEMREAGVLVFAGGLEEDPAEGFSADATSGELTFSTGPYRQTPEFVGGMTIVDVPGEDEARYWGGRVAEACGWPQEVRPFKG